MKITPGACVSIGRFKIGGPVGIWKVEKLVASGVDMPCAELHRRTLRMGEIYSIRQVWPVAMLELVAAA